MKMCPVCHNDLGDPPLRSYNGVDVCSAACCSVLMTKDIDAHEQAKQYDADYFLHGKQTGKSLYENYRWLPRLTTAMVRAMIEHLGIGPLDYILDFGCARGYTVRAFQEFGFVAYGYDTSEWAIENADREVYHYLTRRKEVAFSPEAVCDWVIAKDVLEHVDCISDAVGALKVARKGIFAVVPLAHGKEYDVPEYELDVTHIHRRPLQWWVGLFHQAGWSVEARYRVPGIKDNYAKYPTGNGFITCRRLSD